MSEQSCIFCRIIRKEISSTIIGEYDHCIVIKDIAPKAPVHYLIIPKKHIVNVHDLHVDDAILMGHMALAAQDVANRLADPKAFGLIMNNGEQAGQSVMHMHFHFLSGAKLTDL